MGRTQAPTVGHRGGAGGERPGAKQHRASRRGARGRALLRVLAQSGAGGVTRGRARHAAAAVTVGGAWGGRQRRGAKAGRCGEASGSAGRAYGDKGERRGVALTG